MSASDRTLPPEPSLEQQKKLAKELLHAWRDGDAAARERIARRLPDKARITLADAQFVIAREYGFANWAELKNRIEAGVDGLHPRVEQELRRAFERRDAAALHALLSRHTAARALINQPVFPFGGTALGQSSNDVAMVDVLLEFGADPNRRSDWWAGGFHPLHSATGAVADRLIAAGAVVDACAAANLDRIDLLRRILDDDPARVHERGGDGQTPLHFARSHAVVDLLLERGADIDACDVDHRSTPAQWMLERSRDAGRYAIALHLVSRGASADIFLAAALGLTDRLRTIVEADPAALELRTAQGDYGEQPPSSYHIYFWTIGPNLSPIQVAGQFRQEDALAFLRSVSTPKQRFLTACAAARTGEARELLTNNPDLMDQLTPDDHRTLADAAWAPNAAAVELMMELGFDPAGTGFSGGSALHCAAWEGSAAGVRAILGHPRGRALVNERDSTFHGTPLGWCWHGSENCGNPGADYATVARLLLEAGTVPDPGWQQIPGWLQSIIDEQAGSRS
jgi:ankyrin repeat protein